MIRFRADEYGIDPDRLGILGFSAGGHLASAAGVLYDLGNPDHPEQVERLSSRPDLLILCYPVITMTGGVTHQGSKANLLGDNPDEQLLLRLSSELQVTAETPPTFLWHTSDDASVPPENSLLFAAALSRHHIPFDLHIFTHGLHGLGLGADEPHTRMWTEACASWLQLNGYTKA
jgi:acetyl esterase/lipase